MNPEHSSLARSDNARTIGAERPTIVKVCMALLGSAGEAEAAAREVEARASPELAGVPPERERGALFGELLRECARRRERRATEAPAPAADAETPAARARRLLAELYPTEREALVLRVIAGLGWEELGQAAQSDTATVKGRVSRALARLGASLGGVSGPAADASACAELEGELASVLDGNASDATYEHLSGCDRCRDCRHAAERALASVRAAGSDAGSREKATPVPQKPAPAPDVPPSAVAVSTQKPARPKVDRVWVLGGALALAFAFALAGRLGHGGDETSNGALAGPVVERVSGSDKPGGFAACARSGSPCQTLEKGTRVPAGSRVKTDFGTQATLTFSNGSQLSIERGSELLLATDGPPELLRGAFVAELRGEGPPAVLALAQGSIRATRGKVAIRAGNDDSVIEVASGSVEVRDRGGTQVTVRAGEQSRLGDGPPVALASPNLGARLGWSERLREDAREDTGARGLGELAAKKPGTQNEIEGAVRLTSHRVRVRIAGAMARTEVEEVFTNTTGDVLEGIYRFPLPPDSKIERLALEVDGKLMDGAFVERERAAAIWRGAIVNTAPEARSLVRDEIVWVPGPWRDPALLEWQRGGRFELRVFPIPKHGSRRIVLAYTELLRPAGETRRYVYPLPHDPSGSTRVGRFDLDLELRGHDQQFPVRATGYDVATSRAADAETLKLSRDSFAPSGDLTVEYALPGRRAELSAWTYRDPDAAGKSAEIGAPYVALAIRPKLPRAREDARESFAIVVDSSRSMFGESFDRAKRIATRLVRELDREDRVLVLACDSDCQPAPDGLLEPGPEAEAKARRFLDAITPDGASDPARAPRLAYDALGPLDEREARIVYIGDGAPTLGPTRPDHIEASVGRSLRKDRARVTAVAVGTESDLETLSAVARGGGGVVLPYAAGQSVSETAYSVLGAAYGRALGNVKLELPEGLYAAAPARLSAIPAGGEMLVVARLRGGSVDGDVVLKGEISGQPFEQRYALTAEVSDSKGNAFVPRLYAALRIADLERDGSAEARDGAVKLSTAFNVQSRYTSLLVLESEAMFRAFGLTQQRLTNTWSGEDEAETSAAKGELAIAETEEPQALARSAAGPSARPAARKAAPRDALSFDDWALGGGAAAPPTPAKPAEPRWSMPPGDLDGAMRLEEERARRRTRMVPMRRIWERAGEITTARMVPKKASPDAILAAEQKAANDENRRELTRNLHALLAAASDLDRVEQVLDRWIARDPLDPDALTARADLAARRGDRERAIRLLGSVVDARPGDVGAQRRLERLHRWAGRPAVGCRHLIAASEIRAGDAELLADAVRCSRATGEPDSADRLLASATSESRQKAEALLRAAPKDDGALRGDVRLEATWSGPVDLDLALVDAEGARFSWLGAPTRAVIMARDVLEDGREALAVRGAKAGEYVVELVRGSGTGPVNGELTVNVAGATRRIPFQLSGTRATLGLAVVRMRPRLVPL
jgi:DNA-directed RNA polymerase specialized sigma24 family protein/tetratricopeptide (TPR) repeat protein